MNLEILLLLMVLPPLAGAALNGILGRRFSQATVSVIGCGGAGLSMVFALLSAWVYSHIPGQPVPFVHNYFTWIQAGELHAEYAFYYDRLTLIMTLTVTVVAFLIHLYSRGYMEHEGGYYRFFTYLNLFLFMMLTLVTASNYPLMFVGWEGVGLCSYLLIGFYFRKKSASDAGKKAFIVTRIGDAGFTVGVALLFWTFHSLDFQTVFTRIAGLPQGEFESVLTAIGLLLFLGAAGKSAQLPLYVWLPDAMEGPTPVSALIHAATMVTAGVYLVARSSIIFAHAPSALAVVGIVGCLTAFYAGHHCPNPERSEAHAGVLHHQPTRIHVPGLRRGRFRGGNFPPDDSCVLQVAALPVRRQRDARHGRRTGYAQDGRAAPQVENHARDISDCDAGDIRCSGVRGFLQQG